MHKSQIAYLVREMTVAQRDMAAYLCMELVTFIERKLAENTLSCLTNQSYELAVNVIFRRSARYTSNSRQKWD